MDDIDTDFRSIMNEHNEKIARSQAVPPHQMGESQGLWQIHAESFHVDQISGEIATEVFYTNHAHPSRVVMKHERDQVAWIHPGERVIPTSNHYADGQRFSDSPFKPFETEWYPRKRKQERWWHSWEAFKCYHKRMWTSMRDEQHYSCIPLMDLREAVNLREPNWRERHWRGLYVAKWVGGAWLFIQVLRV